MRLSGSIYKNNRVISSHTVDLDNCNESYTQTLTKCLVLLCRTMGLSTPVWLTKNTKEYAMIRKTKFFQDQFIGESNQFDYFEIQEV